MKKLLLSVVLFFLTFCTWRECLGQTMLHSEILGRVTNSGITISTVFDTVVEVKVVYGTASGVLSSHTAWQTINLDSTGEAVATVVLTGLSGDTKYYYKTQYRKPGSSSVINRPEHSFHTARIAGEPFTFTIEADPHLDAASDTALFRVCLNNQLGDNPDFMIDLGDIFMSEKLQNTAHVIPEDTVPYRCKLLRSFYESACHSIPLYLVLGNHEGEAGWLNNGTPNNVAIWGTKYRKKYYTNPEPDGFYSGDTTQYNFVGRRGAYYSWVWGDAQFIVLDPYWFTNPKPDSLTGWRWTLGRQQYDWLKATLENSVSTFKFVFVHQLVGGNKLGRGGIELADKYEWGGKNLDGTDGWASNRPGWYKPIKQLLEENRVSIFFHGHDHLFAKQDLNCLVYQEVPQACLPSFLNVPNSTAFGYVNGIIIPNSGHLRVNVSSTGIRVDYIRALKPSQETGNLHNKDTSFTYTIGAINCYDSLLNISNSQNPEQLNVHAFPNPFSTSTTIQYTVPQAGDVQLKIYDIFGREVAVIFDEYQMPGTYTRLFAPEKQTLSVGLYICRITYGNAGRNIKIFFSE